MHIVGRMTLAPTLPRADSRWSPRLWGILVVLRGGRAADLLGRRRVFLVALAVFAVASLLGGLVSTGPLLIAARLVKGAAAAFTAPAGLSIITTTFAEGPARNRA